MGTSSLTSLRVSSRASSSVVKEAQAGPNPGARAATVGWLQVAWTWSVLKPGWGIVSWNRPSAWLTASGFGTAAKKASLDRGSSFT